jgi:hypothetical protein
MIKPRQTILILSTLILFLGSKALFSQDLLSGPSVFVFKRPPVKGSVPTKTLYRAKGQLPRRSKANDPTAATASKAKSTATPLKPAVYSIKEQVGVTFWKLRPEQSGETGARLLTMGEQTKEPLKLVAERVELDAVFKKGDKVRISFESPRAGYLYIIDRELRKDGTLGEPYLIFPTLRTRDGDNRVGAGKVIEIPAQTDNPFYFEITPMEANYAGEMLTVLVSPTKVEGLALSDNPIKLPSALVEEWENKWEGSSTTFELDSGLGQKYTDAEKDAGIGTRQLTHKSPSPQSVILVEARKNTAFMVSFPLRVSQ